MFSVFFLPKEDDIISIWTFIIALSKMNSFLSLDELFLSFPTQELNSAKKHGQREKNCEVLEEASDDHGHSQHRVEDNDEKCSQTGPAFLPADYIVTNEEDECYANGKLPSIRPAFGKQKNGLLKKGRNRTEFSCINVDDFSVSDKPVMVNSGREIKETINCRNNLPPPGRQNCPDGDKWENNPEVKSRLAKKKSLDSVSSCNTFVCRPRQLSLGSYTELHGRNRQRAAFSSPVFSKPGRPSDLPEKFSKFLEMEFSIIKGEKVKSTQRYRLRSDSVPTQRREPLNPNSTELRRLRSPSLSELRKPVMDNANRNIKESSRCSISIDSFPPPGPRSSSVGEKRENDSGTEPFLVNKKSSSDSPNSSRVSRARFDGTHSLPSEQKALFTASPKEASPRMSPKEFGDRSLFSPTASRHQVQELPLDLPEKFTKFIEMEFSIPKGENVPSSTQKQKYSVAVGSGSSREKVSLFSYPTELKKTQNPSPLLQSKGEEENNNFH